MTRTLVAIALVVLPASDLFAAQTKTLFAPASICADFATSLTKNVTVHLALSGWMIGYVSGRIVDNVIARQGLSQWDASRISIWLQNYCVSHPFDTLIEADDALLSSVSSQ